MHPDIVDQAGAFLELLSTTSIPATKAAEILNGRPQYEVIKTAFQDGGLCAKYEIEKDCAKNREQLNRNSRAVARLLKCDIYINECRVVAVGNSASGLRLFRSVVECCFMKNEDPVAVARRFLSVPIDEENSSFVLVNVMGWSCTKYYPNDLKGSINIFIGRYVILALSK
ncbi:uncharacterized protein LOC133744965 [Rosa rugosa]|uniref:uncharacterized protein LOC133744965 n=1 Tax=Rosa rugosa TaxID=74645 RepID=UPI002B407EA0|nr:uncharacterized protein LOC133744965 [Rosa rugosa]